MNRPLPIALCCMFLMSVGCAKQTPDTAAPVTKAEEPVEVEAPAPSQVVVAPEIVEMCDIPTAHFDFDSAALGQDAQGALDALAECFTTGPGAGKSIAIVGRADPRGTEEYNLALGQRRSGSVAEYLVEHGVDATSMETSSRGELDATGVDEASWALDRRVDIRLSE